jgi:hypothetical protein
MAKPVGRPRSYDGNDIERIKALLELYIEKSDIPIIAEFAYMNDIPRQTFYDYPEFSTLLKKSMDKKESNLEKLGLIGEVNSTMAIFSLKQLGWRDKQETEITGGVKIIYADKDDERL